MSKYSVSGGFEGRAREAREALEVASTMFVHTIEMPAHMWDILRGYRLEAEARMAEIEAEGAWRAHAEFMARANESFLAGARRIKAKYAGVCPVTGKRFSAGAWVFFTPGHGVRTVDLLGQALGSYRNALAIGY